MGTNNSLFDKHSDFFRGFFDKALSYKEFLAAAEPSHKARWENFHSQLSLTAAQREILGSFVRKMNVLVLAGSWCGDCARQCPMIMRIAEAAPSIDLRFLDNQQFPELRDELRIHGAARVPVVVTLSEDFFEINRFGDRMLQAYRRKAVNEVGGACDPGILPPPAEDLAQELSEWVLHFERLHWMLRLSPFLRNRHGD